MRDEQRSPNWLKVMKDGGAKAALTRKRRRAVLKAVATRRTTQS